MASKLTDDAIKGQWTKQNNAHNKLWNAVVHIASALGLKLGEDGNLVEQAESAQPVAQSLSTASIDENRLNQTVADAIKDNMPVQTAAPKPTSGTISKKVIIDTNKEIIDLAVQRCENRINEQVDKVIEAFGIATDDKAVQPIFEERAIRRLQKFHRFIGKILRWLIIDMCSSWQKAIAYNIAICCALFGGYQYYLNQKLLSEVKRTEVIRYILSGDPANKAMIEKIDSLMFYESADKIWEIYTKNNKHK